MAQGEREERRMETVGGRKVEARNDAGTVECREAEMQNSSQQSAAAGTAAATRSEAQEECRHDEGR